MGGERIDRWLTRLYEKLGSRYMHRIWVASWIGFLLAGAIAAAVLIPYLHPTSGRFLGLIALIELGAAAMMLISTPAWLGIQRVFETWYRAGRPSDQVVGVWKVVGMLRVRWLYGWPLGVVTIGIPTVAYSLTVLDRSVGDSAVLLAVWVGGGGYAALLGFFAVDVYLRPVLRDAATRLPAGFAPQRVQLPIALRLFAALLMISGSTGFFLSFGLSIGSGSLTRLIVGLGLTAAFTLTTALLCSVMITGSTTGPVADLLAVTRRIRSGELGARVPVSSRDEFGLLAANFNEMTAELQGALTRIATSTDAERRRVERDLHDGAQQQLVLMNLKLGMLERDPGNTGLVHELRSDLDRAMAELRDLARGIYPPRLETDGLPGALSEAAGRTSIPTTVDCDGAGRYPSEIEAAVYFCCLEALQNAAKHAGDDAHATVRLTPHDGTLEFEIADDGCGFDTSKSTQSAGVRNMTDRIGALGGSLDVQSTPGLGTKIIGRLPVDA